MSKIGRIVRISDVFVRISDKTSEIWTIWDWTKKRQNPDVRISDTYCISFFATGKTEGSNFDETYKKGEEKGRCSKSYLFETEKK